MVLVRTTPPRPVDVAALFPELAPLARPAVRLHPRPGSPSVGDSSVGGPLLWPAGEPWPHCESTHLHSGFWESPPEIPFDETPPPPSEDRVPLLPVAQLHLRDVPLLRPPGRADLLQILWCPYDHEPDCKPATAVFWREAASVVDVLTAPPEPEDAEYPGYVPEPCLLAPEAITEYPNSFDLSPELRQVVGDPSRWQEPGGIVHGPDAGFDPDYPQEFYDSNLADAPGWKVGGWPPWGRTDPVRRDCAVCAARMVPLLTIASFEWDGGTRGWAPREDRAAAYAPGHRAGQSPAQPTKVEVGSTDNMQVYVCPASPEHPHTDLIQ